MNFELIAKKAYERHDYVRAVVSLTQGLKHLPEVDSEAFDLLLDIYANHCVAPGLEREVAQVVSRHFDAGIISGQIIACLEERKLFAMSRAFRRAVEARHVLVEECSVDSLTLPPDAPEMTQEISEGDDGFLGDEEEVQAPEVQEALHEEPEFEGEGGGEGALDDEALDGFDDERGGGLDAASGGDDLRPEPLDSEEAGELSTPEEEEDGEVTFAPPRAIEWTDEQERDEPRPAAATSPHLPSPSPQPQRKRRSALFWACGVLLAALLAFLLYSLVATPHGAHVNAMDQQLEAFDTLNPNAFELLLAPPSDDLEQEALERMQFAQMLLAMERGQVLPISDAYEPSIAGPWWRGAAALHALQRRDIEGALAQVEAMERRFPDALATSWSRARLEEERGRFEDAHRAYEDALHAHPRFLPALMGQVRIAFHEGDLAGLERAQARLREINPLHPYLAIQGDVFQRALDQESAPEAASPPPLSPRHASVSAVPTDRFSRAYAAYVTAHDLWLKGDLEAAHAQAREALSLEPFMGPALLLQGTVLAAQLRADEAARVFARFAALEQLDVRARLTLMVLAPRALTHAGRPELALLFALEPGGASARRRLLEARGQEFLDAHQQMRPISLSLTREQLDANPLYAQLAMLELSHALIELGAAQDAVELSRHLDPESAPAAEELLWLAYDVMGARQRLEDLSYQLQSTPRGPLVGLLAALARQRYEDASLIALQHPEVARRQAGGLRAYTTASLYLMPPSQVLSSLERFGFDSRSQGVLARQKLRAWAMNDPTQKRYIELREALLAHPVTGVHALLDLGLAHAWQGDAKSALGYLNQALELAPQHPEINRYLAIYAILQGNQKKASEHLAQVGLEGEGDVSLALDLARFASAQGQHALARESLARLLSGEIASPELVDRVGELLLEEDAAFGRKELDGAIARHARPEQALVRSKLLRWAAVLAGSRRHSTEGVALLDRGLAIEQGARGDLLLEKGRAQESASQIAPARESFEQALRYDSSQAQAHLALARLGLSAQEPERARQHLIKYLELDPYGDKSAWARAELDKLSPSAAAAPPAPAPGEDGP